MRTAMSRQIRKSTENDLPCLLSLAEDARRKMRESGNMHQWTDGYPSADVFLHDIRRGVSYVIEESGEVIGTFAFIPSPEPTYSRIYEGEWADNAHPYHVVHRIASSHHARGTFSTMLSFCLTHSDNIRIDTHRDNVIMRHLLEKHGFKYCGIIYLANGDERLAYQKCQESGDKLANVIQIS